MNRMIEGSVFVFLAALAQVTPAQPESWMEIASKFGIPSAIAFAFIVLDIRRNKEQRDRDAKLYDAMTSRIRELEESRVELLARQLEKSNEALSRFTDYLSGRP